MLKRCMVMFLCVGFAIALTSYSFSQDTPVTTEEKKVEDMAGDEVIDESANPAGEGKVAEAAQPTYIALEAKTFFDGINTYANSKVLFKISTIDNIIPDKIEYKIDNGELKLYEAPFAINEEGKHYITYFGTDKLGNREDDKTFKVIIDNTAPELTVITSKPILKIGDKLFANRSTSFTVNATDTISGVEKTMYSLNGAEYSDYVVPFNAASDGEITLKVKSIDSVANPAEIFSMKAINDADGKELEIKESMLNIFLDNAAPTVAINADKEFVQKNGKNIASVAYKYSVTAADNESGLASILVRIDGKGDFMPYKGDISFTTNGEHLIEAKAIDKVGNMSNAVLLSVYVDVVAPQSTINTMAEK